MRINRLTLNNFYRYYGKQEIVFSTEDYKNVTILRGENGAGKTTLLNAFYWVMYGDVLPPLTIQNMLNYRATEELDENKQVDSYVKLEFEDRGKLYTIIRSQTFTKKQGKLIGENNIKPIISYTDSRTGNDKEIIEKDFIDSIIPKRLRHFFFFDGERINKLAQVDGKEEIKKAILDILGLTTIDNTNKDLEGIRSEYTKELGNNSNDEEKEYVKKLESKETELTINEEILEEHKKNIGKFNEELDRSVKYLEQSNSEIVRSRQRELSSIEKDLKLLDRQLDDIRLNISQYISKSLKVSIISEYFEDIAGYLEDKREKGELPSDIKLQFIDDLLERGRCICGCDLDAGTSQYKTVENLKSVAGRSELDDAYSKITSYIKYISGEESFYTKIEEINKNEIQIIDRIDELKNNKESISKELRNSNDDKIRHHETKKIELTAKINDLNKKIGMTENQIKSNKKDIEKIREKIKLYGVNNIVSKKIRDKLDQVEKLIDLNNEIKTYFVDTTRVELDSKIKEVFSKITRKDYREPVLTKDFELKIVSTLKGEYSKDSEVLSTGEGQITSLSFIGSLVEYAREKTKQEFLSDFSGGDFPIVMDSPFGNLDATHTANVAANIGKLASQVIIVVSDKQWNKDVEDNIGHQVGKMYKMYDVNDSNKDVLETTMIKEEIYIG